MVFFKVCICGGVHCGPWPHFSPPPFLHAEGHNPSRSVRTCVLSAPLFPHNHSQRTANRMLFNTTHNFDCLLTIYIFFFFGVSESFFILRHVAAHRPNCLTRHVASCHRHAVGVPACFVRGGRPPFTALLGQPPSDGCQPPERFANR